MSTSEMGVTQGKVLILEDLRTVIHYKFLMGIFSKQIFVLGMLFVKFCLPRSSQSPFISIFLSEILHHVHTYMYACIYILFIIKKMLIYVVTYIIRM